MPVIDPHVSDAALAAFIDGRLDAHERSRLESHFADCDDCRESLVAASRLLASAPADAPEKVSSPRWRAVAALMAVAAVLVLAVSIPRRGPDGIPSSIDQERRTPEESGRVDALLPRSGSSIAPSAVVFVWRAESKASYHLTLTDASGKPLWQATTSDTVVALPSTVLLASGQTYHWFVDAQRLDGSSVTSGARTFTTIAP